MKVKTRILIISEFFPRSKSGEARGGVEMRCWQIAKRLAGKYEVMVLTSREEDLPNEDSFFNIRVIRCSPRRRYTQKGALFKRFFFMISVYRRCLSLKPDIIDAQSLVVYLPAYWAARKLKIKAIITCHDVWLGRWTKLFGILGIIGELYERWYLSLKWDLYIANSHYTKDNLVRSGVLEKRIKVVHNGIDFLTLRSIHEDKYHQFTVCSITRLVSYKRTKDLVEAMAMVKNQFPDIQCRIIGSGPEYPRLKKKINQLGLKNSVFLLGFIKDYQEVIRILKRSHIFCLPSLIEGFGIVVAEAMACSVPVIAARIPPLIEVTDNGQGAVLYQPGSAQELSKSIIRVLQNSKLQDDLKQRGFQLARRYDWEMIVKKIDHIYETIMSQNKID